MLATRTSAQETLQQVRVWMPEGLQTTYPITAAAGPATKYVTIEDVRATNPSSKEYQRYGARDFHLIAFDSRHHKQTYYPIVRPGFASQDFHSESIAIPRETINVTLSFEVPNEVVEANFEFIPSWMADTGGYVDFMYYPGGKAF